MSDQKTLARVTIVIVSWNTAEYTAQCLRSLARESGNGTVSGAEVIVVDNASSDNTVDMVRRDFSWAQLIINQTNAGFGRANNQGIEASQSEYILLLNSDTKVHAGAVAELVGFMDEQPRAGAAGARLLNADGSLQESCRPMLTPGREFWRLSYLDNLWPRASYRMTSWDKGKPHQVETMMGACMMLRRGALDEVGAMDERYFMYTEEVDLCYRLARAGWELWYVPAAKVTHLGQASSRQVAQQMFVELYRSKILFYRKFGGERLVRRFKRLLRLAYWPRLAMAKILSPFSQESAELAARYTKLLSELARL